MILEGKRILITGASEGLGVAVAARCLAEGADVAICARSPERIERAAAGLRASAPGRRVVATAADVSKPDQVRALVATAARELGGLDGLCNNAGVHGPKGLLDEVDWAEWVHAIEVNLLGTAACCREVLPLFRSRGGGKGGGKIVNLSGGGATAPMPRVSAYAASKAAIVRFTETLAVEERGSNIDVNAVAPGALNTRLLDDILDAGPDKVGKGHYERALRQKAEGGSSRDNAAALCAFLLSSESNGISGKLLSAVWDPWAELPSRLAELAESDIYTLRRIVPKDRGKGWGDK
jgi:NAD(P)-dependent dehydrogenase (short-subunit alcohol dehydrogenase family)